MLSSPAYPFWAGVLRDSFEQFLENLICFFQTNPGGVGVDAQKIGEIVTVTNNDFFTGIVNFKIEYVHHLFLKPFLAMKERPK